jgi:cytochrome c oxidase subunit 3
VEHHHNEHSEHIDFDGDKLGMWLFLFSEILLFGGLFVLYSVYLVRYNSDFIEGGKSLNTFIGTLNTAILLFSSFTVAASIQAIRHNYKKVAISLVSIALLCAAIFLVNKYFEWGHKIHLGIYPNSPTLVDKAPGLNIFYALYYTITGLHGFHVIIGATFLFICVIKMFKGTLHKENYIWLENAGLYWHLVDLIWIFVFPLFYLIV